MKTVLGTALLTIFFASLTFGCYSASTSDEGDETGTNGSGGRGGSSSGSNGGSSAGSAGVGGSSGGSSSECSIDSYTFAVSGTTSSCGFALPDLYDPSIVTIYFSVGGSKQPICRHADSQGCALSDGYWWTGEKIALCDETCTLLDAEGGSFFAERGCETEYCSY